MVLSSGLTKSVSGWVVLLAQSWVSTQCGDPACRQHRSPPPLHHTWPHINVACAPPPPCPPLQGSCTHTSSDCSSWVTDGEIQALNTGMGRGAFPLACKQVFQILASTTAGADSRASAQGVAQAAHRILVEEFGLQD